MLNNLVKSGATIQSAASITPLGLVQQMRDYAKAGIKNFWQRQAIFGAALLLAAVFYSPKLALLTWCFVIVNEVYDMFVFRDIIDKPERSRVWLRRNLRRIYLSTILSAGTISFYAIWISWLQGPQPHFMALFFLFAAALFAAMNNHQIMSVLRMRIMIYGATFVFVPAWDLVRFSASRNPELWVQLFTSLVVLYFIVDSSRVYLNFYRKTFTQMAELRESKERAEAAFRAKSEFISVVSHELRTPMTSINGALGLVLSERLGALPEKVSATLNIAQRNGTRLATLINDTLDLQKIESGRLEFSMEKLELGEVLRQGVEMNAPYADKYSVFFELELPDGPVYVRADRARIEQVLANLLSNAAKFSYEGQEVVVRLSAGPTLARVEVIDSGVGIPADMKQAVFEEFRQLDSTDTRRREGTGLGMTISKKIIEAHDGIIDYHANPLRGTTFYFELERLPATWSESRSGAVAAQ
ncbi:sensor histidine kinase [Acidimangrovimonas sediminis]|uniref:sensor histidine kinase n=1 Tax=Acidimangrovimonas sediminis TaxID=2056283 RepID=UPI000C802D75|nr:HAMP domain-containing sensor histidine kinase [Acidimangrovimonas sediminis]